MMEAVRTSETSVYSNDTTRCYIPEGSNLLIFKGTTRIVEKDSEGYTKTTL